ncbi:hypothetical protein BC938DRAFT_481673 [Jimgerdemannia flammicorona]|uniref:Uncharacterized protein n=1 Tax=Jimgerdemannia flammicorona TaxID=994334 RepID=A0A433QFT2_9FUNG|nr:hypothetical protein BC938DRAFT_481673 [Jimgerdemannia flammicorona]
MRTSRFVRQRPSSPDSYTITNDYNCLTELAQSPVHGSGTEPDSIEALIKQTNKRVGKPQDSPQSQLAWLYAFLEVRRQNLRHPAEKNSQAEWFQSTDRIDSFEYTLNRTQNVELTSPVYALGGNWQRVVIFCDKKTPNGFSLDPPKLNTKSIIYPVPMPNKDTTVAKGLNGGVNYNNTDIVVK